MGNRKKVLPQEPWAGKRKRAVYLEKMAALSSARRSQHPEA
jgi:hypothetical protein